MNGLSATKAIGDAEFDLSSCFGDGDKKCSKNYFPNKFVKILVPGTGFEPATSGHRAMAPFALQIMSLAP